MKLELRDLQTSKSLYIDADGAVFGREGGDANIKLRDMGVSKRHARVYAKRGVWFLEDLNSSNGTYVDEQRIRGPVQLTPGTVFSMSQQQYEVVQVVMEDGEDEKRSTAERSMDRSAGPRKPSKSFPATGARPASEKPASTATHTESEMAGEPAAHAPESATDASRDPDATSGSVRSASRASAEISDRGLGYFFVAVPKAIAYYAKSVPLLAVNPVGFVRRGIDEQPHDAMGRMELIAYALPAQLFPAFVAIICSFIAGLLAGTLDIDDLVWGVLFSVAVRAVAAIALGLVFHPLLGFIIRLLKGTSDARSRTNYFLMLSTAYVLTALPSGLASVIGAIRFVNLLSPVLSLVAALATLFVVYRWLVYFQVLKVVRLLVAFGGAAICLLTVVNLVNLAKANFRGGASMPALAAGAADPELRAREATAEVERALGEEGAPGSATPAAVPSKAARAEAAPAVARAEPAAVEAAKAEAEPAKAELPAAPEAEPPSASRGGGEGYAQYAEKRAAIDKAFADNPLLIENGEYRNLYSRIVREQYELDQEMARKVRKEPSLAKVYERQRDAELYKRTNGLVKDLYSRLNR